MSHVLILDDDTTAQLHKLREYAEAHPITTDRLLRMMAGAEKPIGDTPDYCVTVPHQVRVVFSIDHQRSGPMRHLSVSVNWKLPSVAMVAMLLPLLGYRGGLENCHVYFEQDNKAVNVLELVNPDDVPVPTFSVGNPFNQPTAQA